MRPRRATSSASSRHQDKVKITIMFRGREQAHPERGRALLQKLFEDLDGLAVIESEPLQEGRNMSMLLAPGKEASEAGRRGARPAGRGRRAGLDATRRVAQG